MASIKDLKRMCKEYSDCDDCPLSMVMMDISCLPMSLPDNADEIIDKWVQEHTVKTYTMDFFEKFPNARTYKGIPTICLRDIHPELGDNCYGENCLECWNRKIQE